MSEKSSDERRLQHGSSTVMGHSSVGTWAFHVDVRDQYVESALWSWSRCWGGRHWKTMEFGWCQRQKAVMLARELYFSSKGSDFPKEPRQDGEGTRGTRNSVGRNPKLCRSHAPMMMSRSRFLRRGLSSVSPSVILPTGIASNLFIAAVAVAVAAGKSSLH